MADVTSLRAAMKLHELPTAARDLRTRAPGCRVQQRGTPSSVDPTVRTGCERGDSPHDDDIRPVGAKDLQRAASGFTPTLR